MEKGEKEERIRYVQPIPFGGTTIRAANILIDDKGRIWIGTVQGGLNLWLKNIINSGVGTKKENWFNRTNQY